MRTYSKAPIEQTLLRRRELGPLQDLLVMACRPRPDGCVPVPLLAAQLELTRSANYRWIAKERVPARQAARVLAHAEGRIEGAELAPFVDH